MFSLRVLQSRNDDTDQVNEANKSRLDERPLSCAGREREPESRVETTQKICSAFRIPLAATLPRRCTMRTSLAPRARETREKNRGVNPVNLCRPRRSRLTLNTRPLPGRHSRNDAPVGRLRCLCEANTDHGAPLDAHVICEASGHFVSKREPTDKGLSLA